MNIKILCRAEVLSSAHQDCTQPALAASLNWMCPGMLATVYSGSDSEQSHDGAGLPCSNTLEPSPTHVFTLALCRHS